MWENKLDEVVASLSARPSALHGFSFLFRHRSVALTLILRRMEGSMDLCEAFVWVVILFLLGVDCSPMILCVTLNPCLDKTLTVPAWKPGDLVRGSAVREVVGGKGNNVARALKGWGGRPGR